MKQVKFFIVVLGLSSIGLALHAHDFSSTNPKVFKVLSDTLKTMLLLFTIPPGTTTAMHTHPPGIIYVLEGGTLKVEYADGRQITETLTAGQSIQSPPEPPHKTTNIGTTTIKTIDVEISQ